MTKYYQNYIIMKKTVFIIICSLLVACSSESGIKSELISHSTVVESIPNVSVSIVYHYDDFMVLANGYAILGDYWKKFKPLTDFKFRFVDLSDLEGAYYTARKSFDKRNILLEDKDITSFLVNKNNIFISTKDKEYSFDLSKKCLFLELKNEKFISFHQVDEELIFYKNFEGAYVLENDVEENTPKAKFLSGYQLVDTIPQGKDHVDIHFSDILRMSNGVIYECPDFSQVDRNFSGQLIEIISIKELVEKYYEACRLSKSKITLVRRDPADVFGRIISVREDDEYVYIITKMEAYTYKKTDELYFLVRTYSEIEFYPLSEKPTVWNI